MRRELQGIVDEFDAALARLHALCGRVTPERWGERSSPEAWSIGECAAHLNLTSLAYLPLLRAGIDEARRSGHAPPARYRRDPVGWLLWQMMGPPVRLRTTTTAPFVPRADRPMAEVVSEFERLQGEVTARVWEADNLPVDKVTLPSPFNTRVRYNLFAAFSILARHQHRHLWQAERTLDAAAAGQLAPGRGA